MTTVNVSIRRKVSVELNAEDLKAAALRDFVRALDKHQVYDDEPILIHCTDGKRISMKAEADLKYGCPANDEELMEQRLEEDFRAHRQQRLEAA